MITFLLVVAALVGGAVLEYRFHLVDRVRALRG